MIFTCAECGDTGPYENQRNGRHLCHYHFNKEEDANCTKDEEVKG